MADIEYTDHVAEQGVDPEASGGSFVGGLTNVLGTLVSLGLLVGVGIWGYKLMVRDVSGVPVVRAIEGPMRMQPKNPGGQQADHQGLSVNTIAAHGTAAAPADRLMLAPRPVTLADEDAPMGEIEATKTKVEVVEVAQPVFVNGKPVIEDSAAIAAFQTGSVEALVNELTAGIRPLFGAREVGNETDGTANIVQPEPLNPDAPIQAVLVTAALEMPTIEPRIVATLVRGPGPKQSLRPQLRPARLVVPADTGDATNAAIAAALTAATPEDVDADSLPAGTRLAQLGAFDSPDIARAEWDRMNAKFGDYLAGKSRVIQKATSGGRVFYRLRAMGFEDLSDARRFCSALVAENADCIPVTTR
ncbi:MAG: SPOR domain-containing protein [Rhodobacteraceae bacterium]|nr:SPOR domain-containing protein [Paracoccaceae bacterium]